MDLYFSDHFGVRPKDLESYGALNISLVADLPLFIDPFLLFNSKKEIYRSLHDSLIEYLVFLRDKATDGQDVGTLKAWYVFKEVKQNWLGFSVMGNRGSGLELGFARALNENLHNIFHEFGEERVTKSSHLEKLCLIKERVGRDKISDFTTNLIKQHLLEYTETFARKYIDRALRGKFRVQRTQFNYDTETWEEGVFDLPKFNNDFVILTPKELLTKDETWINRADLLKGFELIPDAIPDQQLRFQVNNYFYKQLARDTKKEPSREEKKNAAYATIIRYPQVIDYYIKYKEEHGEQAKSISSKKVVFSENVYIKNVQMFVSGLQKAKFYSLARNSHDEAIEKVGILKEYIENNDGYRLFYYKRDCIGNEKELQLLFGLVCHETSIFDITREANSGRGPVDFKISRGSKDITLVEFKLASNTRLKQNLLKQVEIYKKAHRAKAALKVIVYFTETQYKRAARIIDELGMSDNEDIILIDARSDNKVSASKA